jgi:predicted amino acid dehydrogenase
VHDIYQECWQRIAAGEELQGIPGRLRDEPLIVNWLRDGRTAGQASGRAIAEYLDQRYGTDPFLIVSDTLDSVRDGRLVLCAANSPEPILNGGHFGKEAIVCDIAVPNNVVFNIQRERPDILYMQGGIVATPNGESLHAGARAFLGEGRLFACMAETAVLGLAGFKDHYSYGSISRRQVHEIAGLAAVHGFRLADYKTSHSL